MTLSEKAPTEKIQAMLDNYDAVVDGTIGTTEMVRQRCVCVHGKPGSGKTAFLYELKDRLQYHNKLRRQTVDVFTVTALGGGDSVIKELLRLLMKAYGDGEDTDFTDFLLSYTEGKVSEDNTYEKSALIKYIYDTVKAKSVVIILDDLDKCNAFTVNMFMSLTELNIRIYPIFSYTDGFKNELLSSLIKAQAGNIIDFELQTLTGGEAQLHTSHAQAPNEALALLTAPGRENQLLGYYKRSAKQLASQMDYEKAAQMLEAAVELSLKQGIENARLDIQLRLSEILILDRKYDKAIQKLTQVHKLSQEQANTEKTAYSASGLADCYIAKRDSVSAQEFTIQADTYFNTAEHRKKYYDMYKKNILRYLGLLAEQAEQEAFSEKEEQALKTCPSEDEDFLCSIYAEKGQICLNTGEYEQAIEFFTKSRDSAITAKNQRVWERASGNLAIASYYLDRLDMCAGLYEEVIKNSHNPVLVSVMKTYSAILQRYQYMDVKGAIANLTESVDLCRIAGESLYTIANLVNLVELYIDDDDYNSAYRILISMQEMMQSTTLSDIDKVSVYRAEALFYNSIGDMAQFRKSYKAALTLCAGDEHLSEVKEFLLILNEHAEVLKITESDEEHAKLVKKAVKSYEKVRKSLFSFVEPAYSCGVMFEFILTLRGVMKRCGITLDLLKKELRNEAKRAARRKNVSPHFEPMLLYIQSLSAEEEKRSLLNEALEKASEQKRHRLIACICEDLSENCKEGSEEQQQYSERTRNAAAELLKRIPEQFRELYRY
jgi:tetratricopeptide (TPR) repeat protein